MSQYVAIKTHALKGSRTHSYASALVEFDVGLQLYKIQISFKRNFWKYTHFFLAPNEIFCATAYEEGSETRGHSDGEMLVFPVEIVDRLDSYNNVTGTTRKQLIWYFPGFAFINE